MTKVSSNIRGAALVVAPFEYAPLLINIMWGFFLWREIPTLTTWIGVFLTVFSGMYILHQEQKETLILNQSAINNTQF